MQESWRAFCETADAATVLSRARELLGDSGDLLLVLVGEGGAASLEALVEALRGATQAFFGGIFPELIVDGRRVSTGVLLLRLPSPTAPVTVATFEQAAPALEGLGVTLRSREGEHTLIVLVDGLAPAISSLLEAAYDELGDRVSYWGGGAGTSDFVRRPCLFSAEHGLLEGGAVLAACSLGASLGAHHGWAPFEGPLIATQTEGNVVHALNWAPALEVYAGYVSEHLGRALDLEPITEVTRSYPLGLNTQDQEYIVRDPVGVGPEGALLCVGDVPQNAALSILHGQPSTLIEAARAAALEAAAGVQGTVRHCLVAESVSRVSFLDDGFQAELDAIEAGLGRHVHASAPVGVLTLGEISSRGDGYLEFLNKTCVVAVLHDQR